MGENWGFVRIKGMGIGREWELSIILGDDNDCHGIFNSFHFQEMKRISLIIRYGLLGPVPINDTQKPLPSLLSEMVRFTWQMRNVVTRMQKQFSIYAIFIFWVMVDCVLNFRVFFTFITGQKFQQRIVVSRCVMFFFVRFLGFEIWSILYSTFVVNWGRSEIFCDTDSETLTSDTR